jgi:hypothetical protein
MVSEQAPFVPVPTPLANVLRQKYDYSFNQAGFDRAVEEATKVRNAADSAAKAALPTTAVPLSPPPATTSPPPATTSPTPPTKAP